MRNLITLTGRELRAFFYSPIAYATGFIFAVITGVFFYAALSYYGMASYEMSRMAQFAGPRELSLGEYVLRPLFGNLSVVMLLMLPLLTMRLFSEERKAGSLELLFTWPLTDFQITLGKFLAVYLVFLLMLAVSALNIAILAWFAPPPWGVVACGYLGLALLGAAFLAMGLFMSTLTENQVIAAALSFGALLLFWVVGWLVPEQKDAFAAMVEYLSIFSHFERFSKGVVDTRDVVYYLSFAFLFLFLTLRSLEAAKYRG
ncbi:MAG: ABC transporter permease subunit [Nitrospinae bacterium]|nr:ABC transporter permease subunit [Nitrospinota bacterium]